MDAWGRPTFLYVTGTARKRAVVEREFVAWRAGSPCFAPPVRLLDELVEDLWVRHGDGRAILPDRVEALIAERILEERGAQWPWLSALGGGPVVATALARLRADLDAARLPDPGDIPHAAELTDAVRALRAQVGRLPGHLTRTAALELLLHRLQAPPPALVQQLRQTHSVVLDDLLHLRPLEQAVLVALCRAWRDAGTHVVLSLETGRDLGGAEAGLFFEYDDIDDVAYALRPFRATRALRRHLFDELVASGEADLLLALRDRVVSIEPGIPAADPAEPDLSDHVYGPRPIPVDTPDQARALLRNTVRIERYTDTAAELRAVARQVKRALVDGVQPKDCVVAVPDPSAIAGRLRAIFDDHGVPILVSRGEPLSASPVVTVVRNVATLALQGFPVRQVIALLRSDLVETPPVDVDRIARWCRAAGVTQGPPESWLPVLRHWASRARVDASHRASLAEDLHALEQVVRPLEVLSRPATPESWREHLLRQLNRLAVPLRAADASRGTRATDGIDDSRIASDNLTAWGAFLQAFDELVRDQVVSGQGSTPADVLVTQLERTLATTPRRPDSRLGGAVEVVAIDDLRGLSPRHVWVAGLTRQAWPSPPAASFLVPAAFARRAGVRDPVAESRYVFTSLLRNALDDREVVSLVLSWPATEEGRPSAPSPLLEDVLALPTRVPVPEDPGAVRLLGDLVVDEVESRTDGALARSDVLRLAARQRAWSTLLPAPVRDTLILQRQVARARSAPEPGPWDGVLERAPRTRPAQLSVTLMETYLGCPARYWYSRVLRLDVPEPWAPDVAPWRRGVVLHAILEAFLKERLGRRLQGDRRALAAELHQVATTQLDALAREGGFAAALLTHHRAEWTAGLVDDRPAGVLAAWLDDELGLADHVIPEKVEERHTLPLGPLTLTAQLDRVDRARNGVVVVDYKSGRAPKPRDVEAGLVLQPVAYAAIAAQDHPSQPIATAFVGLKHADAVRRTGWVGDPQLLDEFEVRSGTGLPLTEDDRRDLLDHAADSASRLHRGVFHTTLAEPERVGCSWCDFRHVCRTSPHRARALDESGADLQRPLTHDEDEDEGGAP